MKTLKNNNKILLITPEFPPQKGGISRWAYEEYKKLSKNNNIEVIVKFNNKIKRNKNIKYYFNNKKDLISLINKLSYKSHINIIFFHWEIANLIFIYLFIKKLKYKIVIHGWEFLRPRSKWTELKKRIILKKADKIWVTSLYMKEKVLRYKVPPDKIKLVKIPINKRKFIKLNKEKRLILKQKYNLKNKKIILTVARLVERKDFFTVIKAIKTLMNKNYKNLYYIIIGDGELKNKLITFIKNNKLDKYVKLIGKVSDKKLVEWYNIADVFVLTPKEIKEKGDIEGFGIVYLEANSCGLPVIGSNTGGVKFALNGIKNSYIIEPGDYKKLANILKKILYD